MNAEHQGLVKQEDKTMHRKRLLIKYGTEMVFYIELEVQSGDVVTIYPGVN